MSGEIPSSGGDVPPTTLAAATPAALAGFADDSSSSSLSSASSTVSGGSSTGGKEAQREHDAAAPGEASASAAAAAVAGVEEFDGLGAGGEDGEARPTRVRRLTSKGAAAAQLPGSTKRGRASRAGRAAGATAKCKWGNSCLNCTRAKRKCDGGRPCARCERLGKECIDKAVAGAGGSGQRAPPRATRRPRESLGSGAPKAKRMPPAGGRRAVPAPASQRPSLLPIDDAATEFSSAATVLVHAAPKRTLSGGVDAVIGADSEAPGTGVLRLLRQLSQVPPSLQGAWDDVVDVQKAAEQHMRDLITHPAFLDASLSSGSYAKVAAAVETSLQASPIGTVRIYFTDEGNPSRMYMNNRAATLFGANPVLLTQLLTIGRPILYVHPDDLVPRLLKGLQAHATRQRNFSFEGRYRHADGQNRRFSFFRATEHVAYEYYPSGRPRCVTAAFIGVRSDAPEGSPSAEFPLPLDPERVGLRCDLPPMGGALNLTKLGLPKDGSILYLDDPVAASHLLNMRAPGGLFESMEKEFISKIESLAACGVCLRAPPVEALRGVEIAGGMSARDYVARYGASFAPRETAPTRSNVPAGAGRIGSAVPGSHGMWASAPSGTSAAHGGGGGVGAALGGQTLDTTRPLLDGFMSVSARFDSPMSAALTGGAPKVHAAQFDPAQFDAAPESVDDLLGAVLAAEAPAGALSGAPAMLSGPSTPNVFRTFSQDSTDSLPFDFAV